MANPLKKIGKGFTSLKKTTATALNRLKDKTVRSKRLKTEGTSDFATSFSTDFIFYKNIPTVEGVDYRFKNIYIKSYLGRKNKDANDPSRINLIKAYNLKNTKNPFNIIKQALPTDSEISDAKEDRDLLISKYKKKLAAALKKIWSQGLIGPDGKLFIDGTLYRSIKKSMSEDGWKIAMALDPETVFAVRPPVIGGDAPKRRLTSDPLSPLKDATAAGRPRSSPPLGGTTGMKVPLLPKKPRSEFLDSAPRLRSQSDADKKAAPPPLPPRQKSMSDMSMAEKSAKARSLSSAPKPPADATNNEDASSPSVAPILTAEKYKEAVAPAPVGDSSKEKEKTSTDAAEAGKTEAANPAANTASTTAEKKAPAPAAEPPAAEKKQEEPLVESKLEKFKIEAKKMIDDAKRQLGEIIRQTDENYIKIVAETFFNYEFSKKWGEELNSYWKCSLTETELDKMREMHRDFAKYVEDILTNSGSLNKILEEKSDSETRKRAGEWLDDSSYYGIEKHVKKTINQTKRRVAKKKPSPSIPEEKPVLGETKATQTNTQKLPKKDAPPSKAPSSPFGTFRM